jgi:hypothetical protein
LAHPVGGGFRAGTLDGLTLMEPGFEAVTRAEHLAWCKARALAYVERGELQNAFASMASDLSKHPQTAGHGGLELGMLLLMGGGELATRENMREFIEGFQ